jgi:NAD(P)-dependent dehydrogenase (short-subunit alcohol dehydrogenase family)
VKKSSPFGLAKVTRSLEQGASMATQAEIPSQLGKTAVVTGSTGGLGYETVLALAKAGADIILTGRDERKGHSALDKISREVIGARIRYEHLDLASLASIADFAQRMQVRQSLDLLINNAGVMALPRRQTTADGFEMQFGTIWVTSPSRPG